MRIIFGFVLICAALVALTAAKSVHLKPASVCAKANNHKRFAKLHKFQQAQQISGGSSPQKSLLGKQVVTVADAYTTPPPAASIANPNILKLLIGAGGIYSAFLYYGALQEDVFHYVNPLDGSKFTSAWFLQAVEALANVVFGLVGLFVFGFTPNLPQDMFAFSGISQVSAKAFTSLALAHGVSFPLVTLAKSGKMVPVMLGSLLLGGASYTLRQYACKYLLAVGVRWNHIIFLFGSCIGHYRRNRVSIARK
jgi:hypothetical protein